MDPAFWKICSKSILFFRVVEVTIVKKKITNKVYKLMYSEIQAEGAISNPRTKELVHSAS